MKEVMSNKVKEIRIPNNNKVIVQTTSDQLIIYMFP